MARRMFSSRIIQSGRFLQLPAMAQLLYFHLVMCADDEGVAEGFIVSRLSGIPEDTLALLEEKGFVNILNNDLTTYIKDWPEHNAEDVD